MVKIGTVWDSATEAARGRASMVLPIAAGALFLPSVVQTAIQAYAVDPAAPASGGTAALGLLSIPLMLVTFWGTLAITAIFIHPNTTAGEAARDATARLAPLVGVSIVLGLAAALLLIPLGFMLAAAGVNPAALSTPGFRPEMSPGAAIAGAAYVIFALGLVLWLLARLLPLVPVVLRERLGLGAIGRAFRLTRGMGGRLVGLVILYAVVLGVSTLAVTSVVGLVLRLLLGGEASATATFLGGVAGAVVSTVLGVLSIAFIARFYASVTGDDLRAVFEDEPVG